MKIRVRKLIKPGVAVGLIAFMLLLGFVTYELFRGVPSDAHLVTFFKRREKPFNQLQEMLSEEPAKVFGIAGNEVMSEYSWNRVPSREAGMSVARFSMYREVMRKSGIRQIWRSDDEFGALAGFSGWGFAGKGPRLTYVYRTMAPTNQIASLDAFQRQGKKWTVAYRPVATNWYIRLVW